jgi:outer membrane protein insertion porin family
VFERARALKAAEGIRRHLVSLGYWRAAVRLEEAYDPAAGRIELAFQVEAGPAVAVEVRGPEAARAQRGRLREVLREGAVKADALEEGTDLLDAALRRLGHRDVVVTHREETRPPGLVVVYEVEAGPAARVLSVSVAGDETTGLARLLSLRAGGPLVDAQVAEDARTLVRALEDRGHPSPRVDPEVREGGGDVPVVFRVQTGPPTRIASLAVDSPLPLPGESAPTELRMREGAPYRVRDLARDRDTVVAAYRNAGYLQAEVTPEVAFSEDRAEARVVLHVQPGAATTVDHVVIAGLDTTREEVVRREILVKEGEPLGLSRVLESQHRLGVLGLFERLSVTEMDPESVGKRSVIVRAEEAPRTTVAYGLGSAAKEWLRGSVEVTRRNLFGLDRRISVFARASLRPGFRLVTTYREPYLFGRRQELFVTAYREDEDRSTFSFVRQGITVQTVRALSTGWNLVLRETYEEGRTFKTQEDCLELGRAFCPHTLSGPSASLVHDTRDDALDPGRGHFFLTDAQVSHRLLGGNTLVKGFVQGSSYELLRAGTVLALAARLGLARTFGEDEPILIPTPDRFFAGGDYTLRGFGTDDVRREGGNALLLGGAELRQRLGGALWLAAFAEAGNVYPLVSDLSLSDLRYTAGLGLRYRSAVGPLRFDWGYKLDRRPREKPFALHFTIGHAF